jgi:hypothetical protein
MNIKDFFNRYKKIFAAIGFIGFVVLIGYFIWTLFFAARIVSINPTPTTTPGAGLPGAQEGGQQIVTTTPTEIPVSRYITPPVTPPVGISPIAVGGVTKTERLGNQPTLNPIMSSDGKNVQYYNQDDGKFYKISDTGESVPISDKVFYNVSNVVWAPNTSKAVIEYPDKSKVVYDFNTNKQVTLPKHWEDFNFSPNSDRLVMKSLANDPDNRWLIVSDSDGTRSQAIEYIGTNDAKVYSSWSPNNQTVAMYTKGLDLNRQDVIFLGLNGENFKSTTVDGRGFQPKWSERGDKLLYSVFNTNGEMKPKLWIVNAQGDNIGTNRQPLEVETWAEKCTFANNTEIYCAVPKSLPTGAGVAPELAKTSDDNLYKINTQTGEKTLIAIPDGMHNIGNIMFSADQNKLFFRDSLDSQIYKVDLK